MTEEEVNDARHYVYTMISCMAYNFVGVILIAIAGVFRFKIKGDLSVNQEEGMTDADTLGIDKETASEQNSREYN